MPQARGRASNIEEQRGRNALPPPGGVHHPADLGIVIGGQPGVPDHLVARNGEKVNGPVEAFRLVQFDLEVEGLRRLAGPSQPVDVGSISAPEPAEAHDGPRSHGSGA